MAESMMDLLKKTLDPESFKKLADVRSAVSGKFMKLGDGLNTVRVLPPWKQGGLWFREVHNHFRVGGADKGRVVVCNAGETPPQKCFVDDVIALLAASPNKDDRDYAAAMASGRVFWTNAYDVKSAEPIVKILPFSFTVFGQLFQLYISGEDFVDPDNGYNVVIQKQPGNRYNIRLERQSTPVADRELLTRLFDLDAVVSEQIKTYEEQKTFFPEALVARVCGHTAAPPIPPTPGGAFETPPPPAPPEPEKAPGGEVDFQAQMAQLAASVAGAASKVNLDEIK